MRSVTALGTNFGSTAFSWLIKPGMISAFLLNIPFNAIWATLCGVMLKRAAIFLVWAVMTARVTKSVSVLPGLRQLTEMEVPFNSCRKLLVNDLTNAFDAA